MVREINSSQLTEVVRCLTELHEWELNHAPLLSSLTGRHLYYRIAARAVGDRELLSRSLKDLVGGVGYTEKALRTRMREMEAQGFVEAINGHADGRSRYLMPTEKFYESVYLHASQVKKTFENSFFLIEK